MNCSAFKLISSDIQEGQRLAPTFCFTDAPGDNLSPELAWQNAPKDTKSFAVTMFDPDAPTGSGWYHWNVIDIPASINKLNKGEKIILPAREMINDFSAHEYDGACPPIGHGTHRYIFTVWALPFEKMPVEENASAARIHFILRANALASSSITTVFHRE